MIEEVKKKLKDYTEENVVFTGHAKIQAIARNIQINEVKQNIINPIKLIYVEEQKANQEDENKYDCYFECSNNQYHRYILVLNDKCIICTVIRVQRKWQRIVDKKLKEAK